LKGTTQEKVERYKTQAGAGKRERESGEVEKESTDAHCSEASESKGNSLFFS